ncbi:MAG: acyloxyacyl hydrolase [Betaproteobacteria bacterium]|nr:acyloxyacyl hydrolase [Betaproteobacteria bacterium]
MRRLLTSLLLLSAAPVWALSGMSIEIGHADNARILRASSVWNLDQHRSSGAGWHLAPQIHVGVGAWNGTATNKKTVAEIFVAPSVRYRPNASSGQQPYIEAGLGAHLISESRLDDQRDLGANLLVSEHLAMGVVFGDRSQYDLSYRFQHMDNAGQRTANPGLNAHQVRLLYNY